MKKKFCVSLILLILIISGISPVYADIIIPGHHFNEYKGVEKFGAFIECIKSPLKEISVIILVLFIVLGLVLITLKAVENKNDKNNKNLTLPKIFLAIGILLDYLSIYILKTALVFHSDFTGVRTMSGIRARRIEILFIPLYIIYTFLLIIITKKKNHKVLYALTTGIVVLVFIICIFVILNTDAYYYTYDINSLFPF